MSDGIDFLQHLQLRSAASTAHSANLKASDNQNRIDELEKQVDALLLACRAMWELLGEPSGFLTEDLNAKIDEIDLRDGRLDGKLSLRPVACASCGKPVAGRRAHCLYCGSAMKRTAL